MSRTGRKYKVVGFIGYSWTATVITG